MATPTIQSRITLDNKQHDEAFRKSKQQVYNYSKQVDRSKASVKRFGTDISGLIGKVSGLNPNLSSLIGIFSKFAPAIGLAAGALGAFNKIIQSTDKASDAFDSVMVQATASVDYFFSSIARGDFSGFLDGLGKVQKAAKEARDAMDNLEDSQMAYGTKYGYERSRLHRIIRDPKSSKEERDKAQKELDQLPYKYEKEIDKAIEDAEVALINKAKDIFKVNGIGKYFDSDYIHVLDAYFNPTGQDRYANTSLHNLGKKAKDELKEVYSELYRLKQLKEDVFTETFRDSTFGDSTNSTSSTKTTPIDENNKWDEKEYLKNIEWNVNHYYTNLREKLNEEKITFTPILNPVIEERPDASLKNVLDTATEMEYWSAKEFEDSERRKQEAAEKTAKIVNLQIDTISSLSSAFSTLGNEFDSKGLNIAGIIAEAIANIAKAYSVASVKQAAGSITGWDWLAFSVGGLAQVASVIAQIHSLSGYASGGIIGGNSYTGDKVLARVNSGEMILNPSQQANLFNMINGGVSTGGEVKFRIDGSTLVGVLNNYNKKVRRVM